MEVDSWYYKIPSQEEAAQYRNETPDSFVFTWKVVQEITVPYKRNFPQNKRGRKSLAFQKQETRAPDHKNFSASTSGDQEKSIRRASKENPSSLEANPGFLSPDVFHRYCEEIEPLRDKIALLILEFEYLNREKMESLAKSLDLLDSFLSRIGSYRIVRMSIDAKYSGRRVILNVNDHYEGSAPLTIAELRRLFEGAS